MSEPRKPIDMPPDFGQHYDADDRASFPFTLLTGIAFGILLGLGLGELWSLVSP